MNRRRLYRCRHDRVLTGVAGGVAEYFDVDPSLVRIVWFISIFFGGLTLLLYIAMAILVPIEPEFVPAPGPWQPGSEAWGAPQGSTGEAGSADATTGTGEAGATGPLYGPPAGWHASVPYQHHERRSSGFGATFFGIVLILFGALALADQLLPSWVDHGSFLWPAFILAVGVLLVVTSIRRRPNEL